MDTDLSPNRIALIRDDTKILLDKYFEVMDCFCTSLKDDLDHPAWMCGPDYNNLYGVPAREYAAAAFRDIEISDDYKASIFYDTKKSGATIVYHGAIGVSDHSFILAGQVNSIKLAIAETLKPLTRHTVRYDGSITTRTRELMKSLGRENILLKMVYRKINMLSSTPVRISYTHSNCIRSIKRITVADAIKHVKRYGEGQKVDDSIDLLNQLESSEILALVGNSVRDHRINLKLWNTDKGECEDAQMKTNLPFIFACDPGDDLPPIKQYPKRNDLSRNTEEKKQNIPESRRPTDILPLPYTPIGNIYRYYPNHRPTKLDGKREKKRSFVQYVPNTIQE